MSQRCCQASRCSRCARDVGEIGGAAGWTTGGATPRAFHPSATCILTRCYWQYRASQFGAVQGTFGGRGSVVWEGRLSMSMQRGWKLWFYPQQAGKGTKSVFKFHTAQIATAGGNKTRVEFLCKFNVCPASRAYTATSATLATLLSGRARPGKHAGGQISMFPLAPSPSRSARRVPACMQEGR